MDSSENYSTESVSKSDETMSSAASNDNSQSATTQYLCSACKATFTCTKEIKKHIAQHTKTKDNSAGMSEDLQSQSSAALDEPLERANQSATSRARDSVFTCDICCACIKGLWNLTNHIERCHTVQYSCMCKQCGRMFTGISELQRHIHTHMKDCPNSCPKCGQAEESMDALKEHLLSVHDVSTLVECPTCCQRYTSEASLKRHVQTHGVKSVNTHVFQCPVCQKEFPKKYEAKVHLKKHFESKPYKCTKCPKAFSWKNSLAVHQKWHAKDYHYSCRVCHRGFLQSSALLEHMRSHIKDKPYTCSVCQKSFVSKSNLSSHLRQHTGEQPYRCKLCISTKFTNRHSLVNHMSKLHGQKLNSTNYTMIRPQHQFDDNVEEVMVMPL